MCFCCYSVTPDKTQPQTHNYAQIRVEQVINIMESILLSSTLRISLELQAAAGQPGTIVDVLFISFFAVFIYSSIYDSPEIYA